MSLRDWVLVFFMLIIFFLSLLGGYLILKALGIAPGEEEEENEDNGLA